jgi:hypothetical protein
MSWQYRAYAQEEFNLYVLFPWMKRKLNFLNWSFNLIYFLWGCDNVTEPTRQAVHFWNFDKSLPHRKRRFKSHNMGLLTTHFNCGGTVWGWNSISSGIYCCVVKPMSTEISEVRAAYIIRSMSEYGGNSLLGYSYMLKDFNLHVNNDQYIC